MISVKVDGLAIIIKHRGNLNRIIKIEEELKGKFNKK
jgi:hypothetical protein